MRSPPTARPLPLVPGSCLALVLLLLAACEAGGGTAGGGADVPDGAEPPPPAAACGPWAADAPGEPRLLVADAQELAFGPCGHLLVEDAADALLLAEPDLAATVALADRAWSPRFDATGGWLAWWTPEGTGPGTVELLALASGEHRRHDTAAAPWFGFAHGAAGPVLAVCERSSGAARGAVGWLDGAGFQALAAPASGCAALRTGAGPTLAWADGEGALWRADVDGGAGGALDGGGFLQGAAGDEAGGWRRDALIASPDGRVLAWQVVRDVPCGDTFCSTPEPTARLWDLATGAVLGDVAATLAPVGFNAPPPLLAAPDGHRLLFPAHDGTVELTPDLTVRRHAGIEALALLGAGPLALVKQDGGEMFRDLAVLDLDTGESAPVGHDPGALAAARDGAAAAASTFTTRCVRHADRPQVCHAQIWALTVWTAAAGARAAAFSHQPVYPRWVGEDGTVLAYGGFYEGEPPTSAPEADPEPPFVTRLFAPDGSARATWPEQAERAWEAHGGAVLLVVFEEPDHVRRLDALRVATGVATTLARGRELAVAVDAAGERVAWAAYAADDASRSGPRGLWAGAVPSPR
jgi:hypothetical protein